MFNCFPAHDLLLKHRRSALSCHSFFIHWNEGTKTAQEEKSIRFIVHCLLSKLMFVKNLGARVARDQDSARTSIHLSNPNICKLFNVLHHSLSIGQLCHLLANSKITNRGKSQSLKMLWSKTWTMKHGCVSILGCGCGCGCGTRQFLKK